MQILEQDDKYIIALIANAFKNNFKNFFGFVSEALEPLAVFMGYS